MSSDRVLRILLSLLLVPSCSVKENRTVCPCNLTLELTGLPVRPVVLNVVGEGFSLTEVVHADTVLVLPVPKGEVAVSAVGGALAEGDGSVRIPEGEEAPPLYLFHSDVSTDAEQVFLPVMLHKQFCTLELTFKGPLGYAPPFEAVVEYAIVAENTVIDEDAHVGDSPEAMADHLDDWGIAVIGEKITIGKGAKVDAKQMIDTDVEGESK